ncbi:MAG: hypothetical protein EOP05_15530 [Proteobacteria bacterium]|nr:MAG: hypothetical protein EOP05_15530 [Pseudomonadota bacterium]
MAHRSEVLTVDEKDLPIELTASFPIQPNSEIEFLEESGRSHVHSVGNQSGFCHLSLRVYPNFAAQADCVITKSPTFDAAAFGQGDAAGIRFQPFFIKKKGVKPPDLRGKGLFARGLHYGGLVTPSNVLLSGECDDCEKSFLFSSFHAGFSEVQYFYSSSGLYTVIVNGVEAGKPEDIERKLPSAPDMTKYSYLNPFRCPHCKAAYIDFEKYPEIRAGEYYGNHFPETKLQRF